MSCTVCLRASCPQSTPQLHRCTKTVCSNMASTRIAQPNGGLAPARAPPRGGTALVGVGHMRDALQAEHAAQAHGGLARAQVAAGQHVHGAVRAQRLRRLRVQPRERHAQRLRRRPAPGMHPSVTACVPPSPLFVLPLHSICEAKEPCKPAVRDARPCTTWRSAGPEAGSGARSADWTRALAFPFQTLPNTAEVAMRLWCQLAMRIFARSSDAQRR